MTRPDFTASRPASGKVAHHLMREVNRSLLVDLLRSGGQLSRVDLARLTALSKPTVSSIVEELVADGLAVEVGTRPALTRGGRPPSLLAYNESAEAFAGIQFGVHSTRVAIADGRGALLQRARHPSRPGDALGGIDDAATVVRELLQQARIPASRLRGVGVAVPGMVHADTGRCPIAPNLGWHDVPVRDLIEDATGVSAIVLNIPVMAARAEGRDGAAAGIPSYVWVYAGTGIGAGIVHHGDVLVGSDGFAGEIGHCPVVDAGPRCSCGNTGCLETVASAGAVVRLVGDAMARGEESSLAAVPAPFDIHAVTAAVGAGDALARRVVEQAGEHLGRGISYLTNVLNPALVVVGGPLVGAGDVYLAAVRRSFERHTLGAAVVPVEGTRLGADAPLLGAVQTAAEWQNPSYRIVGGRPA